MVIFALALLCWSAQNIIEKVHFFCAQTVVILASISLTVFL